ncbi:MAG TPA: hypothetical protein VNQ76_18925 [Planctomicrobium sp.]|nr:hypothetical protein [Planctomicrobium sp.]
MKRYLVDDDELISLLDSHNFQEVTSFPYEINDNMILFRRGTISRWGGSMSSGSDSLSIATPNRLQGIGTEVEPAFIWRTEKYQELIFIRSGKRWVGAYHESGELLSSASRY